MQLPSFWQNRRISLLALGSTVAVLVVLRLLGDTDAQLLAKYNLSSPAIEGGYVILIVALAICAILEPRFRKRLRASRLTRVVVVAAAGVISFWVVGLILHPQETRLFQFPFSLWLMIVHVVGLCALAVWQTTPEPWEPPNHRLKQTALVILAAACLLIVGAHIASLGEFMRYDAPDEPWLTSMATNFADHGDLSPSYIASIFGTPDPALPRFYWAMGLWFRLAGHDTLAQMRTFPLVVGATALLIFGLTLWRISSLTTVQRIAALFVFLTFIPFVRTSHNLRMDVGLVVYGALLLAGLLMFYEQGYRQKRWPFLMGMSLFIGLETIPTVSVLAGMGVGLTLIGWVLRQPDRRRNWQYVAIYTAACAGSVLLYFAAHFLPDVEKNLEIFRAFSEYYFAQGMHDFGLRIPLDNVINVQIRYHFSLSPLAVIAILGTVILAWRSGRPGDRWLVITAGLSLILLFSVLDVSFGYHVLYTPFVAYFAARALQSRSAILIGVFVFAPALLVPPFNDMLDAAQRRPNQIELEHTRPLADQIPTGATIVGEPVFWYMLHNHHTYIGWTGVSLHRSRHNLTTLKDSLAALDAHTVICWEGYTERCASVTDSGLFEPPTEYLVGEDRYWIFQRL